MLNYKVGGDENSKYENPSPLITSESHCQHQQATEKSVLNKGLNFTTTIKLIPYLDLITQIKDAALKIPKAWADELRWKVRQALKKSKPPKPNVSKAERD